MSGRRGSGGGDLTKEGEMVWARIKHYPYWPAIVVSPNGLPPAVKKARKKSSICVVKFFGETPTFGWIDRKKDILPIKGSHAQKFISNARSKQLRRAIEMADEFRKDEKSTSRKTINSSGPLLTLDEDEDNKKKNNKRKKSSKDADESDSSEGNDESEDEDNAVASKPPVKKAKRGRSKKSNDIESEEEEKEKEREEKEAKSKKSIKDDNEEAKRSNDDNSDKIKAEKEKKEMKKGESESTNKEVEQEDKEEGSKEKESEMSEEVEAKEKEENPTIETKENGNQKEGDHDEKEIEKKENIENTATGTTTRQKAKSKAERPPTKKPQPKKTTKKKGSSIKDKEVTEVSDDKKDMNGTSEQPQSKRPKREASVRKDDKNRTTKNNAKEVDNVNAKELEKKKATVEDKKKAKVKASLTKTKQRPLSPAPLPNGKDSTKEKVGLTSSSDVLPITPEKLLPPDSTITLNLTSQLVGPVNDALPTLKELLKRDITLDILKESGLGVIVKKLRKNSNKEVASYATVLHQRHLDIVQRALENRKKSAMAFSAPPAAAATAPK